MSVVALIEFYFKLIICITIPEEPKIGLIHASPTGQVTIAKDLEKYITKVDKAIGIFVVRSLDPRNR
ncbi:MAG: hypothetical protein GPI99_18195 [Microcystis aeruginosa W13-15]|nr:hypothetical protein [Microcystis aeruginosa W13-16]NCQ75507.1 hypothetical protein [Microcystis aeruginosa W13-13]NCQ79960.1 hypothetical protein [Microcystis aeruginosa W13-15]